MATTTKRKTKAQTTEEHVLSYFDACSRRDVDDGKITRNTAYYDGAAFARGLGLLPQTGSGGEKAMLAAFNAVTKVRSRFASPPPR